MYIIYINNEIPISNHFSMINFQLQFSSEIYYFLKWSCYDTLATVITEYFNLEICYLNFESTCMNDIIEFVLQLNLRVVCNIK